jgi:hypothetical protein
LEVDGHAGLRLEKIEAAIVGSCGDRAMTDPIPAIRACQDAGAPATMAAMNSRNAISITRRMPAGGVACASRGSSASRPLHST